MLKLKLQYFGHLMQRPNSLEKTLMLGKIEGKRRGGLQRVRWLDSITNSMDMSVRKFQEIVEDRGAWCTYCRPSSHPGWQDAASDDDRCCCNSHLCAEYLNA